MFSFSLTEIPQIEPSNITKSFEVLLNEADTTDNIHDCILQVGQHQPVLLLN